MPDFVARYAWAGSRADDWVNEFLASDLGKSKLAKLARAMADERHLVVLTYPDTDSGLGIARALAGLLDGEGGGGLLSAEPPMPLTHLWLIVPTPDQSVPVGAQLGLVRSPFPTRAATGGLSRRRAGVGREGAESRRGSESAWEVRTGGAHYSREVLRCDGCQVRLQIRAANRRGETSRSGPRPSRCSRRHSKARPREASSLIQRRACAQAAADAGPVGDFAAMRWHARTPNGMFCESKH